MFNETNLFTPPTGNTTQETVYPDIFQETFYADISQLYNSIEDLRQQQSSFTDADEFDQMPIATYENILTELASGTEKKFQDNEEHSRLVSQVIHNCPASIDRDLLKDAIANTTFHVHHEVSMNRKMKSLPQQNTNTSYEVIPFSL